MLKNFPRWVDAKGIYYGWIVLFVGTLGIAASIPGQTMGVSVYTDNLLNALGLDRSQISLAYLIGTLSSGLFLPFVGRVLDQRGSRFVAVSASVSLAFFVFLMSKSALISDYFAQQFSLQKMHVSFVVITLIYFGVRQFGQGQLTLSSRTMIGLWFERRRGLAFGISGLVVSFAFGIAPWLLIRLSNRFGSENSLESL